MILHLMGLTMYTKDFYSLICSRFSDTNPIFVNNLNKGDPRFSDIFTENSNYQAKVYRPISIEFLRATYKSDAIVLHGLFNFKYILFFALQPWLLKKCNWVIWGGDIYCHNKENQSLKERLAEKLKNRICKGLGFATTLTDSDFNLFLQWYRFKGVHLETKYPTPLTREGVDGAFFGNSRRAVSNTGTKKVILGNSATETNQHFQALDFLSKFKYEDIHIYLPLSYGQPNTYIAYADSVIKYAEKIFGEAKITPIREKMDGAAYMELVSQMDVGIFNCNRQQAMGNISILFASGAKVYIRTDTTMWRNYMQRGNMVYDVEKIPYMPFEEFWAEDQKTRAINCQVIKANTSIDMNVKRWRDVFSAMC